MDAVNDPRDDWTAVAEAWDARVDEARDPTAPATEALLERLDVQPGERVLELAAGPGSLGPVWSALVTSSGRVLVSDNSPGMVEVARRRNDGLANVAVDVVDASAIDRADGSFDVVASRMGLMFTPDPSLAFTEIHRVLAPGGRMAVLTWGGIEHNPWMTCVGMAAMMNGLVAGGPPIGPGGIFSLADPALLESIAGTAGFVEVETQTIGVTFRAESIDAHITSVSALAGPLAAVLHDAPSEKQAAVRRAASDLAASYVTDDGVAVPGQALLTSARKAPPDAAN